jgi:hypothetical protein
MSCALTLGTQQASPPAWRSALYPVIPTRPQHYQHQHQHQHCPSSQRQPMMVDSLHPSPPPLHPQLLPRVTLLSYLLLLPPLLLVKCLLVCCPPPHLPQDSGQRH